MASFTMQSVSDRFSTGTTVSVKALDAFNQPTGAAITTAVVAADGSLAFSGLADSTRYAAVAGSVVVRFSTPPAPAQQTALGGDTGFELLGNFVEDAFAGPLTFVKVNGFVFVYGYVAFTGAWADGPICNLASGWGDNGAEINQQVITDDGTACNVAVSGATLVAGANTAAPGADGRLSVRAFWIASA